MRDNTSGYDQPRTDPIPTVPGEADFAEVRTQPGEPGYADATPGRHVPPAGGVNRDPGYADMAPAGPVSGEPGFADAPTDRGAPPTGRVNGEPGSADAATIPGQAGSPSDEDSGAVLFGGVEVERFRGQWRDLQAGFVDNPAEAVQSADRLVDEVLQALTEVFNAHKQELETQWQGGETEELRVAMRRYRSFFDQLLNA
ncbi:MAG TPA: hypothetical protein VGP26_22560 [Actinophytocola sp.]|jgi:hypothetical protein|nr:hypothetical protein [Actinophytocola sp.]